MSYIVPLPLPSSCILCPFAHCVREYPAWSKERTGIKILYCTLKDKDNTIEINYTDFTTKAPWCPLKEME